MKGRFLDAVLAAGHEHRSVALATELKSGGQLLLDGDRLEGDLALDRVAEIVADWSGGTRIGHCIAEFNRLWSRRVLGQGAVVLLITDGLDRDAGTGLAHEMDRLHRSSRRLIWLNPLLRYEGFEPRSLGMKAMLPHVDEFRPVHNLESLETLVSVISAAAQRQSAAAMAQERYGLREED